MNVNRTFGAVLWEARTKPRTPSLYYAKFYCHLKTWAGFETIFATNANISLKFPRKFPPTKLYHKHGIKSSLNGSKKSKWYFGHGALATCRLRSCKAHHKVDGLCGRPFRHSEERSDEKSFWDFSLRSKWRRPCSNDGHARIALGMHEYPPLLAFHEN